MIRTISGIGKALGPKLPPMFSDVVLCKRDGTKWTWNTAQAGVDTKARNLPWADNQPADFRAMFKTWRARALAVGGSPAV